MADGNLAGIRSLKGKVSEDEWRARVDPRRPLPPGGAGEVGRPDLHPHLARVPGPEHHFLINPFGMYFEEVTASSLVKVDLDGNIVMDSPYGINAAGYVIHSAVHGAREDARFVIHIHSDQGVAVSAQSEACCRCPSTRWWCCRTLPTTTMRASPSISTNASGWSRTWATSR